MKAKVKRRKGKIIIGNIEITPPFFPESIKLNATINGIEGNIFISNNIEHIRGPHNDIFSKVYTETIFCPYNEKPFGIIRKEIEIDESQFLNKKNKFIKILSKS